MSEEIVLRDGEVLITTSSVTVGSTMYPVGGITAVSMNTKKGSRGAGILLFVLGVVIGLVVPPLGAVFAIPGLIVALTSRDKHVIALATAGLQATALETKDLARAERVAGAIRTAISRR